MSDSSERVPRSVRRGLGVAALALAVGAGLWFAVLRPNHEAGDRAVVAHQVVERYVGLIATGGEGDLEQLLALTVAESPGDLRAAGDLLVRAEERIEVVEVGEARPLADRRRTYAVGVRYRLDGSEHEARVALEHRDGTDGTETHDWRVVEPLTGSIDWLHSDFAGLQGEAFVAGVRRTGVWTQDPLPLYPGVYETQRRLDPYYASARTPTTVPAAQEPTVAPTEPLRATDRTKQDLRQEAAQELANCDQGTEFGRDVCPVRHLAYAIGVQDYGEWWVAWVREPTIVVDDVGNLTLTDGVFEMVDRRGRVVRVGFEGQARSLLDNQSWTPAVIDYELERTS